MFHINHSTSWTREGGFWQPGASSAVLTQTNFAHLPDQLLACEAWVWARGLRGETKVFDDSGREVLLGKLILAN